MKNWKWGIWRVFPFYTGQFKLVLITSCFHTKRKPQWYEVNQMETLKFRHRFPQINLAVVSLIWRIWLLYVLYLQRKNIWNVNFRTKYVLNSVKIQYNKAKFWITEWWLAVLKVSVTSNISIQQNHRGIQLKVWQWYNASLRTCIKAKYAAQLKHQLFMFGDCAHHDNVASLLFTNSSHSAQN